MAFILSRNETLSWNVELRTLPYYLWPLEARHMAVRILSFHKKKILSDLFPMDALISKIEREQQLQQELEADLEELFK